jgi:membrane protease YdiL (CAAX protease family)
VQGNDQPGGEARQVAGSGLQNADGGVDPSINGSAAPSVNGSPDPGADQREPAIPAEAAPPYPSGPYPPAGPYPPGPYPPAGPYPPGPYPPAGPYPPGPYPPAHPTAHAPGLAPRGRDSGLAPSPTRTHRWGLGAYIIAEGVFLGVSMLIGLFVIGTDDPTVPELAVSLAAPTVLGAAVALLITWVRGNGPRTDLGLEWSWRDLGLGIAFGVSGVVLSSAASVVYISIFGPEATSAVADVFGGVRAGPALAVTVFVLVVFVAPLCEEILYRGLLWGAIERLGGRWWAFGASTLVFALAHFEYPRVFLLPVVAIPIALARLYTGRLLASIVAHQINNLLPGIVLMLGLMGVVPMV